MISEGLATSAYQLQLNGSEKKEINIYISLCRVFQMESQNIPRVFFVQWNY